MQEKQREILAELGDNGNFDLYPIATIELEPCEEQSMEQSLSPM